ncbi:MAG: thioredoxin family protein [Phycisphaeraceae bacterium]|nr:thioredoxin family protein [Phycisphaerales bacterium]MCA9306908.1 thioredoxin family protein [Phycisphaerales bacterium]MCB9843266.1 thioredoxin family protein [Phycisphaeraceae bacterium]
MKARKLGIFGAAMTAIAATALTVSTATGGPEHAEHAQHAAIGEKAPDFTLQDASGKTHKLSDYTAAGKTVVLEWFNPKCPFVVRHHETKTTFNDLYEKYNTKDVVFLAVNSSNRDSGVYGFDAEYAKKWGIEYPILIDESGEIGKMYGAKTTPHMFVIDSSGDLRYMGAIDNDQRGNMSGDEYVNYVGQALDQILAHESVSVSETKSYGCSVKYRK